MPRPIYFCIFLAVQINTVKYLMNASCGIAIECISDIELHDLCRSTDASYSISVNQENICLYSNKLLADSVLAASST